jgi:type I restriction enzyme S subunit
MSDRVPEGWKRLDLEDGVSALISGQSPNRKENRASGDAFGILKTTAIDWGRFDEQQNQEVLDGFEPNKKHLVLENDILLTKAGPAHRVGVVAQARNLTSNVLVSGKMTAVRVNDQFLPDFLTYALCQEDAQNHLKENTTGMALSQTNFTHDALLRVPILSPPLPEQKKIASILTSVDEVIETTQKQIDKLQDLKKATMNELLTQGIGHTEFKDSELGRIPKSWEVYELGQLCIFTQGVQISLDETLRTNQKGYIRYLYINDFSSDKNLRFIKDDFPTKIVKDEDLVMANTGHSAGTIFRGKHGVLSNNAFKISIKKYIKSEYLFHFLSTDNYWFSIGKLFNTAGQPHVGHGNIAKLQFLCPPLNEQDKIISIIQKIDQNMFTKQRKLSQTQSLKKSLMQDLLTGKVRVQVN